MYCVLLLFLSPSSKNLKLIHKMIVPLFMITQNQGDMLTKHLIFGHRSFNPSVINNSFKFDRKLHDGDEKQEYECY